MNSARTSDWKEIIKLDPYLTRNTQKSLLDTFMCVKEKILKHFKKKIKDNVYDLR